MQNRVTPLTETPSISAASWTTAEDPQWRLAGLFLLLLVVLLGVGTRIAYLQIRVADTYEQEFDRVVETVESIPSRDARIISADGQILAHDVTQFQIAAHYRWLESPPDPSWLRMKALGTLTRKQRRDPEQVQAAEKAIIAQQEQMWRDLAALAQIDDEELTARRQEVQNRVEHIVELVEERRRQRLQPEEKAVETNETETSPLSRVWATVVKALTTAPDRGRLDPIVIREQLDYHTVLTQIDLKRGMAIEAHPERFPGLKLIETTRRRYPQRELAAHIIGYRREIDADALAARKKLFPEHDPLDYRLGDRVGRLGIEASYERRLHGLRGERRLYANHRGELLRTQIEREPLVRPDVNLTIDTRLQKRAEALLDAALAAKQSTENDEKTEPAPTPQGGAIVAIDVHTGAILAAATAPRFDLELISEGDQTAFNAARQDRRSPFLFRPTQMTLPPGSIFKTVTAAAGLESGTLVPHHGFYCQGYLDKPEHHRCHIFRHYGIGHGDVDLQTALARSCNVYFYTAARRSGPQPIVDWAAQFGFGRPTGLDIPSERGGHLPDLSVGSGRNHRWQMADTLGLAIGQSSLTVTPLQIARMMAVIANGGYLVTPHLVSHVGSVHSAAPTGEETEFLSAPRKRISGLSGETLAHIHDGLVGVIEDPQGTGHKTVKLPGASIAGKTGTAEVGGGKTDHAWFAGYAPAEQPQVAFVVTLEHAGSGGKTAGPLARELVKKLIELGYVEGSLELAAEGD